MSHHCPTTRVRGRSFLPMAATLALVALGACKDSTRPNTPPTANAGPDMSANVGEVVHLNGSGSDVDGDNLTYSWTFVSKPTGSTAALSGATSASASFTADVGGQFVVLLTVNDGKASQSDQCTVSVNSAPTANAGPDQSVSVGDVVQLDGSSSSDPEGDNLSYSWTMSSRPTGSAATLQNGNSGTSTFTPDRGGDYVIRLVVNDGSLSSEVDECIVSANTPPTANAGPDQTVSVGAVVQLDGTGSSDPDAVATSMGPSGASNAALGYLWSFDSRPNGSTATLSSATSATPTFTADMEGTFVIRLVVNDGTASSAPDLVTITATEAQTPLYLRYVSPDDFLSNQAATSGAVKYTLYGSGSTANFPATLGTTLTGTTYGFSIWLGAGTASGQTGTWTAKILIQHNGVETTLATHAFSVPFNTYFVEYDATVTGIAGGVPGDRIILRLTMTGVSQAAILYGAAPADSHILVPGTVTVTKVSSPAGVSPTHRPGPQVHVTTGNDLRYSGG
jgi:K319L-like, PKD domain